MTSVIKNKKYYTLLDHITLLQEQKYFRKTIATKKMVTRIINGKPKKVEETVYEIVNREPEITLIIGDKKRNRFKKNLNPFNLMCTKKEFWLKLPVLHMTIKYNNVRIEKENAIMIDTAPNKENVYFDSKELDYSVSANRVAHYNGLITIYLQDLPESFINSKFYENDLFSKDVFNSLMSNGNTIYSRLYYKKALEYFGDKKTLENKLSKVCGFNVRIREARSDLKEDASYLNPEYYIIESDELRHSKSVSNPK